MKSSTLVFIFASVFFGGMFFGQWYEQWKYIPRLACEIKKQSINMTQLQQKRWITFYRSEK